MPIIAGDQHSLLQESHPMPMRPGSRVLVAYEFSGIVREAFKVRGHDAWSCDYLPTEIPGQHYQGDVWNILHDDDVCCPLDNRPASTNPHGRKGKPRT